MLKLTLTIVTHELTANRAHVGQLQVALTCFSSTRVVKLADLFDPWI